MILRSDGDLGSALPILLGARLAPDHRTAMNAAEALRIGVNEDAIRASIAMAESSGWAPGDSKDWPYGIEPSTVFEAGHLPREFPLRIVAPGVMIGAFARRS